MLGALDLAKTIEAERFCHDALVLHARLFRLWYRFRGDPAARGGPLTRQQLIAHVFAAPADILCPGRMIFGQPSQRRAQSGDGAVRHNGESRRRTKTQASLPGQDAVLLLLFGLLRSGYVTLRKIDGWEEMARVKEAA